MTRKKEIIEASHNYGKTLNEEAVFDYEDMKCAFKKGAKWADEHPNLESLWHDASEKPRAKEWLLIQFGEDDYDVLSLDDLYIDIWCTWCKTYNVIRWAYISDLLPKGGEK